MNKVIKFSSGEVKDVGNRTLRFIGTDETVDRDLDVISFDGWDFTNYTKNPVVLLDHNYKDAINNIIGRARPIPVPEARRVDFEVEFAPAKASANADRAYRLAKAGFLKTVSVGFIPGEVKHLTEEEGEKILEEQEGKAGHNGNRRHRKPKRKFMSQELLELSLVSIPSNPNAVSLALSKGVIDDTEVEEIQALIEELGIPFQDEGEPVKKSMGPLELALADLDDLMEDKSCEDFTWTDKEYEEGESVLEVEEKPFPNEHACRVREPKDFQDGSFRRISRGEKRVDLIIGRLKGEQDTTLQAFRYPKDIWTATEARNHCTRNKGRMFEPATGKGGHEDGGEEVGPGTSGSKLRVKTNINHTHTFNMTENDGPIVGRSSINSDPEEKDGGPHSHPPGTLRRENGKVTGRSDPGGKDEHIHQAPDALEDTTTDLNDDSEKKGAISWARAHSGGTPKAAEGEAWNGPAEIRESDIDGLVTISTWVADKPKDDLTKGDFKLPHHKADGGHAVVLRGVRAAMGALLGARGGVDIPSADRRGVFNHLARHLRDDFDVEAPEFRDYNELELKGLESEGKILLEQKGSRLAAMLNRRIDSMANDERSRADIIGDMAEAGGIERGTLNGILEGSINCPPLQRLRGFARVLGLSFSSIRSAAESDGCEYDSEGRVISCPIQQKDFEGIIWEKLFAFMEKLTDISMRVDGLAMDVKQISLKTAVYGVGGDNDATLKSQDTSQYDALLDLKKHVESVNKSLNGDE